MWIRDPRWKKFGSGIRDGKNSDPQHCTVPYFIWLFFATFIIKILDPDPELDPDPIDLECRIRIETNADPQH
jgi:hypothetical protein